MTRAFVALGANLGPRAETLRAAVAALGRVERTRVVAESTVVETPALVPAERPSPQPAYLNAVVELETSLTAPALFAHLLRIETELGRVRTPGERWGPRVIDLDLLLFGDELIDTPGLVVPHPRLHERDFVLGPLVELAPGVVHPVLQRTLVDLFEALRSAP